MTTEKYEVMTAEDAGKEIDRVIEECLPVANQSSAEFDHSLKLAKGIGTLRKIFLSNPAIKETIEAMQDSRLGFQTDRPPGARKKNGEPITPYSYPEVAECCVEAMLQGYRLSGNEFNIIAGNMYAAKNGKYRRIIENENISAFQFTTTPPLYETETRVQYGKPETVQFARVQAYASWKKGRARQSVGEEGDKLVFKIKVNQMMGDDAIVGKALSKLFTRVLMRIEGNILPESTDLDIIEVSAEPAPRLGIVDPDKPIKEIYPVEEPGPLVPGTEENPFHNGTEPAAGPLEDPEADTLTPIEKAKVRLREILISKGYETDKAFASFCTFITPPSPQRMTHVKLESICDGLGESNTLIDRWQDWLKKFEPPRENRAVTIHPKDSEQWPQVCPEFDGNPRHPAYCEDDMREEGPTACHRITTCPAYRGYLERTNQVEVGQEFLDFKKAEAGES